MATVLVCPKSNYVQRLFLSRSSKTTVKATYVSALISVPVFMFSGGIGLIAYCYQQGLNANDAFPLVVHQLLPIGISGIVIAALLSIILSSASGLLNAAAIAFVNDIVKPLKASDKEINFLKMARISTIIIGVVAVFFALSVNNIISILLAAYNFWSPIILVPLIAAIFNIKSTGSHFFIATSGGIVGSLVWHYGFNTPMSISPILFGILCNLAVFIMFSNYKKIKHS